MKKYLKNIIIAMLIMIVFIIAFIIIFKIDLTPILKALLMIKE